MLKTHPTLLPKPPKVTSNNTNTLKPLLSHSEQSTQREIPIPMCPQPTKKSPLLPTPPEPARPQIKTQHIPEPHTHSESVSLQTIYFKTIPCNKQHMTPTITAQSTTSVHHLKKPETNHHSTTYVHTETLPTMNTYTLTSIFTNSSNNFTR